ncbi:DUF58 domain-containing protein [Paenibacillus monticola]|uniref:DUF58 domain-containing protein n=1 Tax=Paenibacillus monticola TaxID=2666075 RepID=A0A7X2H8N6_9BACL|nr:DUF58 domain-containing protein [Paenibacillus monticola]MRN55577.1 DUF58 domain-containing protein [Paenibacillus monticola]
MSSRSLYERKQQKNTKNLRSVSLPRTRRVVGEWLRMLSVTGIIGILYAWRGGGSLLFLLIALGIIMLNGLGLQLFGPRRIKLVRTITPARPVAGDILHVKVQVSFHGRLPLPWMTIVDYWSGIRHHELLFPGFRRSFSYTYTLEGMPRGIHHLQGCRVTWGDLPGWFTGRIEPEDNEVFRVLPAPLYFGGMLPDSGVIPGAGMSTKRGRSIGEEALDIRDYTPGDPQNRIHWKNSARRGSLQTRVPERERGQMSCVVLANCPKSYEIPTGALAPRSHRGATPPAFEKAVSAAMGLMLSAERTGTYIQLFSGGWPEGTARHEGLGKIPGRVLDFLTGISPDSTRSLSQLLEDASRSWIPGMTVSIITGQLEEESAKVIARFLVQGVKVDLYYAWDSPAPGTADTLSQAHLQPSDAMFQADSQPVSGSVTSQAYRQSFKGSVGDSLTRLGARLYRLDTALPASSYKEVEFHGLSGKPTLR